MYERAARPDFDACAARAPIWHLDQGRALFIGALGRNALHAHSVPVYMAGVYAPFRLRVAGDAWRPCQSAVIPAGVPYEFDMAGQPLAVLYLEPNEAGAGALAPLLGCAGEVSGALYSGALLSASGGFPVLRELYEADDGARWAGAAIDDLLAFSKPRARRALDLRISHAVARLASGCEDARQVADVAREAGLSPSRFQHLFAAEIGVPFRRFRVWQRLRRAIAEISGGASFTAAAHAAGFFDQAHFARAFRAAFGAPASPSLRKVRRG
ncbi:AraC family transcriptional regulator [uncultured Hyphomicrobium sp.]|uniref:helix-turn-helix domain-containing protein n=1 Tax=uncultured Hyphomicrobium sp. TaxID=194373 RepID=UPI0025DF9105|nr:AraC family transcriptional regulator [uncultured Hyphomicrobium sp.]